MKATLCRRGGPPSSFSSSVTIVKTILTMAVILVAIIITFFPVLTRGQGDEATTGFGCYDIMIHKCSCEESLCGESQCATTGGTWTDGCTSCQCAVVSDPPPVEPTDAPVDPTDAPVDPTDAPVDPTDAPVDPTDAPVDPTDAPVDPTDAPVDPTEALEEEEEASSSFGCYNLPSAGLACTCTSNVCSESSCTDQGGIWTDACLTCACGEESEDAESEEEDASNTSASAFGCFSLPDALGQCTCSEDVCQEDLCASANGTWTDRCTTCTCGSGESDGDDGDPTTGWGCYDITVNRCGCAAEFCALDTCEEAGGIFTDGCGTCQCQETFPPGEAPESPDIDTSPPTPTPMPTLRPTVASQSAAAAATSCGVLIFGILSFSIFLNGVQ